MQQSPKACRLFQAGAIALAKVTATGIRIDVDYLEQAIEETQAKIRKWERRLRDCEKYGIQRQLYGQKTNIDSRDQLARVLFDELGYEPGRKSKKTGKPSLDQAELDRLNLKYTRGFQRMQRLKKLLSTYLIGIQREVDGEYLHPQFHLDRTRTYRSSSSHPNFHNIPIRNEDGAKRVRTAFIPRDGHLLVEIDFNSLEVMVACCLSGDEKLIHDSVRGDMHRDMTAELFFIDKDKASKQARSIAKGFFVFPTFYGDYYKNIARNIWREVERLKVKTENGVLFLDWLREKGIFARGACRPDKHGVAPGTFEYHVKRVENRFWNERFKDYDQWRRNQVELYNAQGYLDMVTGFRSQGEMRKNQIINFPIQGPAFHCLLWSLVKLQREMKKTRMRSVIVGQIHDSILADVHKDELDDYIQMAVRVTTEDLPHAWRWITVPFSVEVEASDTNWYEMKKVEL